MKRHSLRHGEVRDGGPILKHGMEAMEFVGSPPPQIEIGTLLKSSRGGRRNDHLSFSHPGRLLPPDAIRHLAVFPDCCHAQRG